MDNLDRVFVCIEYRLKNVNRGLSVPDTISRVTELAFFPSQRENRLTEAVRQDIEKALGCQLGIALAETSPATGYRLDIPAVEEIQPEAR